MSSKHIQTRHKIQEIPDVKSFNGLLNNSTLSDMDKQMLEMHYLQGKDFRYIGDTLGFSESTIKKRHKKALQKLNKLL